MVYDAPLLEYRVHTDYADHLSVLEMDIHCLSGQARVVVAMTPR